MSAENPSPAHEDRTGTRKFTSVFIAVYLLLQLAVPLRYYFGDRLTDSRFSWRMFSSTGQQNCRLSLIETVWQDGKLVERPIQPDTVLPRSWLHMLKTSHRQNVAENFLGWYCRREGVAEVRYESDCTLADGTPLAPVRLQIDRESLEPRNAEPAR